MSALHFPSLVCCATLSETECHLPKETWALPSFLLVMKERIVKALFTLLIFSVTIWTTENLLEMFQLLLIDRSFESNACASNHSTLPLVTFPLISDEET